MTKLQKFVMNALVLAVSTLVMRTVGVAFNAYISSKIGAEGMGLFTLVMSVYGFAVTLATSGIGLATMRLVADALGKDDIGLRRAYLRRCLLYAAFFGGLSALLVGVFSRPIGENLLGDARTVPSLRLFSFSLLPMAFSGVFCGYFNAMRRSARNAAAQIFDQTVQIFLTVFLLTLLLPKGLEYACIALVLGGTISEILSCLFLFAEYEIDIHKEKIKTCEMDKCDVKSNRKGLLHKLICISMPVAFSAYVRSGLVTVEHVLIPRCLFRSGQSKEEALSSYGALHGMAIPILLYPAAILSSFTGLLLPETAESLSRGEKRRIRYITERALSFAFFFSVTAAGAMFLLADELGALIYHNSEVSFYVMCLVPLVPVMYLDTTVDNILKGIGEQFYCMCVNVADAAASVILVLIFLPKYGAVGYVAVLLISEVFNFSLSIARLYRRVHFSFGLFRDFLLPLLLTVASVLCSSLVFAPFAMTAGNSLLKCGLFFLLSLLFYVGFGVLGRERRDFLLRAWPLRGKKSGSDVPPLDKAHNIM